MSVSVIYSISFDNSGGIYYGSTVDFNRRIVEHKRDLKKGKHANSELQRLYDVYGPNIKAEAVAKCPREYQLKLEQWFLDTQLSVNIMSIASGGVCSGKGVNQYDLEGNFIRTFKTIREASRTTNTQTSSMLICCKRRIGAANGYQWRYIIDNLNKIDPYRKPNSKRVNQYSLSGNFIKTHNSIRAASITTETDSKSITHACRNKLTHAGEYQWRYFEEGVIKLNPIAVKDQTVDQYSLEGVKLSSYKNIAEASRATGIEHACIWRVVRNEQSRAGKYKWRYSDENLNSVEPYCIPGHQRVSQFSLEGGFIKTYSSAYVASEETGADHPSITACCKGIRNTSGKYKWRYFDPKIENKCL
jgi:predicted GIY-YIG superfamily endonuclease